MKVRFTIINLLIIVLLAACSAREEGYTLEGEIQGLTRPALYICSLADNYRVRVDTITANNNQFSYTACADSLSPVIIYMEDGQVWTTVWVQNGQTVQVKGNANFPDLIRASGNEVNDHLSDFRQTNEGLIQAINTDTLLNKDSLTRELHANARIFIEEHPASIASLVLIQDYISDVNNSDTLQACLNVITEPAKSSELYRILALYLERMKQTAVGVDAPGFAAIDHRGDTLELDSLKEDYIVLAFELPTDTAVFRSQTRVFNQLKKDYTKQKVDVVRFVFDENASALRRFLTSETKKLNKKKKAQQARIVIDSLGLASPMVPRYNLSALPDYYLLDKERKIVLSHTSVDQVEEFFKTLKQNDVNKKNKQ